MKFIFHVQIRLKIWFFTDQDFSINQHLRNEDSRSVCVKLNMTEPIKRSTGFNPRYSHIQVTNIHVMAKI